MHYGNANNELRFVRYANGFGAFEANGVTFDMDAGANALFVAGNGNIRIENSAIYLDGAHSTVVQQIFRDNEDSVYGRVYGDKKGSDFYYGCECDRGRFFVFIREKNHAGNGWGVGKWWV